MRYFESDHVRVPIYDMKNGNTKEKEKQVMDDLQWSIVRRIEENNRPLADWDLIVENNSDAWKEYQLRFYVISEYEYRQIKEIMDKHLERWPLD